MTEALERVVSQLDEWGRPAWLVVMVAGFILFWPIGLALLGYMIWSGRMGCGRSRGRWGQKFKSFAKSRGFAPTGNRAFDEYRDETLRRLEEEAKEFSDFLERLRMARDRKEFEDFMADRKSRQQSQGASGRPGEGFEPGVAAPA